MRVRQECDAFGPVEIPADRYYGAQTQRALEVFGGPGQEVFPPALVRAAGLQKLAAARANFALGTLSPELIGAIEQAAREVWDGRFDDHFPLPVWQTGSGTQTNMNANEVIANRANELLGQPLGTRSPVHPNDHVNRSQSSNDSFPTMMHIAVLQTIRDGLTPALTRLRNDLSAKAHEFSPVVKIGRTHMMDAVPMTVGQGFDAFARHIAATLERLDAAIPRLGVVPQGGTAIGTGLNAPEGFDRLFCEELSRLSGQDFTPAPSKFEGMAAHDELVALSGVLNVLAVSLIKIANDLRLLGSGPRCGLGELVLPPDGLTSSIMPGKTNPTVAEAVLQAAFQAIGNHATITAAGASGSFELNVAKPVIVYNLLQSIRLLGDMAERLAARVIVGLDVDRRQIDRNVNAAILPVTALNPVLGYDAVARITRRALADDMSPRDAAIALGLLTAEEYDRHVSPSAMTNVSSSELLVTSQAAGQGSDDLECD
jgi:fumarate hydratase class II